MSSGKVSRASRGFSKWPVIVVGLLLMNVGICVITIIAATSNPVTIEPDYYDKALRWDELKQLEKVSAGATLSVSSIAQGVHAFELRSVSGDQLFATRMTATAVHESEPGVVVPVVVTEIEPGRFEFRGLGRAGLWTVTATVWLDPSLEPRQMHMEVSVLP